MSTIEDFKCYSMICPSCEKELIIPDVIYENVRRYGSKVYNFKCNKCDNVIKAYFNRNITVIVNSIQKSDKESDWD